MKEYTYYLIVLSLALLVGSCQKDEDGELLKVVHLKVNFNEYSSLPNNSQPHINKYFTPQDQANKFLQDWLFGKYFSVKEGSIAHVTYDFRNYDKPAELLMLSNKAIIKLKADDYKMPWNNIESNFYTPTISPESSIPLVLNKDIKSEEGDYQIVEYNYSPVDATILYDQKVHKFNEDFNSPTSTDWGAIKTATWFNKITEGTGRVWSTILNKTATTPNAFSYNRTEGADSWLVTSQPIDLTLSHEIQFSFDFGWGYYVTNEPLRLQILVSESFDGSNPLNSNWTDVTDQFLTSIDGGVNFYGLKETVNTLPSSGYPGLRAYTIKDFSTYYGKKIYIAFRDKLLPVKTDGSKYSTASLYFIDNIKITEIKDVATSTNVEKRYDVFNYADGKWKLMKNSIYVLQPGDYLDPNNPTLSSSSSASYIATILNNKFGANEGERKIVVYLKSDSTTLAEDYIYENGSWKQNAPPIIKKTDKYVFKSLTEKWVFESSL